MIVAVCITAVVPIPGNVLGKNQYQIGADPKTLLEKGQLFEVSDKSTPVEARALLGDVTKNETYHAYDINGLYYSAAAFKPL